MKKPTMKMYLVWNMTNYDNGFEHIGLYNTRANAEKAYNKEMKKRYGTTNEKKLWDLWDDGNNADSWRIDEVEIKD